MAMAQKFLGPMGPGESQVFGLDYKSIIGSGDTIATVQSVALAQVSGTGVDPDPMSRLDDLPVISGSTVQQRITDPVVNCVYELTIFVVTANEDVLSMFAYLACNPN